MPEHEFTYRACSCRAQRTFRLHRPLPILAEFYAVRDSLVAAQHPLDLLSHYDFPNCPLSLGRGALQGRFPVEFQPFFQLIGGHAVLIFK